MKFKNIKKGSVTINYIRNQVMSGIIGVAAFLGGTYIVGSEIGRALSGKETVSSKVYNETKEKVENIKQAVEQRIENEKAIKAYGIQAKSYAEAKQKLDSIRFNELCSKLNVSVPQKPERTGDKMTDLINETSYHKEINNIYQKAIIQTLEEFGK